MAVVSDQPLSSPKQRHGRVQNSQFLMALRESNRIRRQFEQTREGRLHHDGPFLPYLLRLPPHRRGLLQHLLAFRPEVTVEQSQDPLEALSLSLGYHRGPQGGVETVDRTR